MVQHILSRAASFGGTLGVVIDVAFFVSVSSLVFDPYFFFMDHRYASIITYR